MNNYQVQESKGDVDENSISRMSVAASMLIILTGGCAPPSTIVQPAETSYMRSAVGICDELSPLAPPEARNVRKVGNQWHV